MRKKTNFDKAKIEADAIDNQIIDEIRNGKSFIVEAGAGAGKTYSLNKAIEWIQENKENEFVKKNKNVACITYTNVAVGVIADRLKNNSFIKPSTIHTFAWDSIKQFQSAIIEYIRENEQLHPKNGDITKINQVMYALGSRYIESNILYLFHQDVIALFVHFLDNSKFRMIFTDKYPIILIDEYQDSFKIIVDKFIQHFINQNEGPQFGFFGDSWQTIYQMNKPCGSINNPNLSLIAKGVNFRSPIKIVSLLNKIRPALPQISAIDEFEGEVFVVHCNDFKQDRRSDRNFNGDLPFDELKIRLDRFKTYVESNYAKQNETTKTLMLTHRILAEQQGYENLLAIIGDKFKDESDEIFLFCAKIIEPIFEALENDDMILLSETFGLKRYPISSKSEKLKWKEFHDDLKKSRNVKLKDVFKTINKYNLVPTMPSVIKIYSAYLDNPNSLYENSTLGEYFNLDYNQILSGIKFLYPDSEYATDHGVKGEEFDNVIFTISRGWANYQFDVYAPMINGDVPKGKESSFERNRNLFYVCCSRAIKRLFIFVTLEVSNEFEDFLKYLVGNSNYFAYEDFLKI